MSRSNIHLVESAPLPYLLSLPGSTVTTAGAWPLLCFLHGHDEGAPTPIKKALTRHGPLAATSSPMATEEFIVVAPQMTTRGDLWYRYAGAVREILQQVQAFHRADPRRIYLTGFSFGGNGVFDLGRELREVWAALWPVDPTRVPRVNPEQPIWLSSGQVSRRYGQAFIKRLHLEPLQEGEPGDRVYVDQGKNHVGTARLAYQDDRIYRWLLARQLPGSSH
jgi:predicted peptidase